MNYNLRTAEAALTALKLDLGVPLELPHALNIQIWRHKPGKKLEVQCHVSVFITDACCELGYGATFLDAFESIKLKILNKNRPTAIRIEESEDIKVCTS